MVRVGRSLIERVGYLALPPSHRAKLSAPRARVTGLIFMSMCLLLAAGVTIGVLQTVQGILAFDTLGSSLEAGAWSVRFIGGWLIVATAVFMPRAAFRIARARTLHAILRTPINADVVLSRSVVVFNPLIVAALLGAMYVPTPFTMVAAIVSVGTINTSIIARRRHARGEESSVFDAVMHMFLTGIGMLIAWSIAATYGLSWATAAYVVDQPLTEPGMTGPTLLLIPLLMAASILATLTTTAAKSLIYRSIGQPDRASTLHEVFDPMRFVVAAAVAMVAWIAAVTSEFAGVGQDTFGMLLGGLAWLAGWAILWAMAWFVWGRATTVLLTKWGTAIADDISRISAGLLSSQHAQLAALQHAARIAASVYGADLVTATLTDDGSVIGTGETLAPVDRTGRFQRTNPSRLRNAYASTFQIAVYDSREVPIASLTVIGSGLHCMSGARSHNRVTLFQQSFKTAMLAPRVNLEPQTVQDMFTAILPSPALTPGIRAFQEACARLIRDTGTAATSTGCAYIAGFRIVDFPDYLEDAPQSDPTGMRLTSAIARSIVASPVFTGGTVFTAIDTPGRIWLAGIAPSVPSARHRTREAAAVAAATEYPIDMDTVMVDVRSTVAAYGTDGITIEGLMQTVERTLDRPPVDQALESLRDPWTVEHVVGADMAHELLYGLTAGEVKVHAYPITNLTGSNRTSALLSFAWDHPRLGHLNPTAFRTLLENDAHLRDIALPVMFDAVRVYSAAHHDRNPQQRLAVAVDLPSTFMDLPLEDLPTLTRALREQATVDNTVVALTLRNTRDEHVTAMQTLHGLGLHIAGALQRTHTNLDAARMINLVGFDPATVEAHLADPTWSLETYRVLYSSKHVQFCALVTTDVPLAQLRAIGFHAAIDLSNPRIIPLTVQAANTLSLTDTPTL